MLVPELDEPVPAARRDLGGLDGVPDGAYAHPVVRLELAVHLGGLPVPQPEAAVAVDHRVMKLIHRLLMILVISCHLRKKRLMAMR